MTKRAKTFEQEVINTYEQIAAAVTGVAICWRGKHGRSPIGNFWTILYIKDGKKRMTNPDPKAAWYDYNQKTFSGDKKEALEAAKAWVKETYGYDGEWVRNSQRDYVPKDINDRFPLRKEYTNAPK